MHFSSKNGNFNFQDSTGTNGTLLRWYNAALTQSFSISAAAALAATTNYTWPSADGTTSGDVMQTNASGVLSFRNIQANNKDGSATTYTYTAVATTTGASITLDKAGTYFIIARGRTEASGATFAANRTTTLAIRRTNNTPADLRSVQGTTGIWTTTSQTLFDQCWFVIATTTNTDDTIELFASIDVVPTAGSLVLANIRLDCFRLMQ